jgi:hypothetical protein
MRAISLIRRNYGIEFHPDQMSEEHYKAQIPPLIDHKIKSEFSERRSGVSRANPSSSAQ